MLVVWGWRVGLPSGVTSVVAWSPRRVIRRLPLVILDGPAVLAGKPLELDDVEPAAGDDEAGLVGRRVGIIAPMT